MMRNLKRVSASLVILAAALSSAHVLAAGESPPPAPVSAATAGRPTIAPDGTINVPSFQLPPSEFMSKEAVDFLKMRAAMPMRGPMPTADVAQLRAGQDRMMSPFVALMRQRYPANMTEESIGGVRVRVFTPKDKPADRKRVLINLHGGAFSICWEACSILESQPIASVGGFKVISVNYRMAPEHRHPAGVEDAAAVYRELLKTYKPQQIGIYGCSAGGVLTAQAAAWFPRNGLPQAGAIGIFGAGGVRFGVGDSAYLAGYVEGSFPPPAKAGEPPRPDLSFGYFNDADLRDPIVSPALHLDVLAKFPPSLIITGTRAMDMSPAVYTNSQLLKAGVRSTLIVGEAAGHCYVYFPQFPEAQDAYTQIVRHFRENLG